MPRKLVQKDYEDSGNTVRNGMEELESIKIPTNIRLAEATAEKFRKVASNFSNQDAALNAMLGAYQKIELQKNVPAYAKEIEAFQSYLDLLLSKYVSLLLDYNTVDEKAKISVNNILQSKDATILELGEKISGMETSVKGLNAEIKRADDAEKRVKELEVERAKLLDDIEKLREQDSGIINDKETINGGLRKQIEELTTKLDEYSELPGQLQHMKDALAAKEQELKDKEYQHQLSDVAKERSMNSDMEELRKKHAEKMEALRQKYDKREESIRAQYEKRINRLLGGGDAQEKISGSDEK